MPTMPQGPARPRHRLGVTLEVLCLSLSLPSCRHALSANVRFALSVPGVGKNVSLSITPGSHSAINSSSSISNSVLSVINVTLSTAAPPPRRKKEVLMSIPLLVVGTLTALAGVVWMVCTMQRIFALEDRVRELETDAARREQAPPRRTAASA